MPREDVVSEILAALEARAAEHDVDIVDVEVVGSSKEPCVRVRIDHADESLPTIALNEVAAQTRWISDCIDELDPIPSSYTLEVSSPGLARPLRRAHDFERFAGEQVQLTTTATEGRRRYTGLLLGIEDEVVHIEADGEEFAIPLVEVKRCTIKPVIDFNASASVPDSALTDFESGSGEKDAEIVDAEDEEPADEVAEPEASAEPEDAEGAESEASTESESATEPEDAAESDPEEAAEPESAAEPDPEASAEPDPATSDPSDIAR